MSCIDAMLVYASGQTISGLERTERTWL